MRRSEVTGPTTIALGALFANRPLSRSGSTNRNERALLGAPGRKWANRLCSHMLSERKAKCLPNLSAGQTKVESQPQTDVNLIEGNRRSVSSLSEKYT